MKKLLFFTLLLISSIVTIAQNKTYTNARFGYSVTYPTSLLKAQPESENKDGRQFNNKANEERLRCWGTLNMDADAQTITLKQKYEDDLESYTANGATLNYKRFTNTFYVLSGKDAIGNNFYLKVIPKPIATAFACLLFLYPDSEKKMWEPQIKPIGASFK